ncbi:hypothetical protein [Allokutzneria sp. NRRL B-24872]|uniref:hypothetical protein n=1 Tax=Allokutzneria sp. NRRL B-24872 TaxID=1137961 RepID=UPI000A3C8EE1|nr:hypothetical protein [Allokutzneria sp. NRRL B-24872]
MLNEPESIAVGESTTVCHDCAGAQHAAREVLRLNGETGATVAVTRACRTCSGVGALPGLIPPV